MTRKNFLFVLMALSVLMVGCEFDKPTGDGVFSVSSTQQVRFASGNLVYDSVAKAYGFAQHQYDYGDYFRWNTGSNPLTLDFDFIYGYDSIDDWGSHIVGGWRTLTAEEWRYVIGSRSNYDELCASATVCDVPGMVLMPDNFQGYVNTNRWTYSDNEYDAEEWAEMEAAGCVFLPAAGYQESDSRVTIERDKSGRYWSISTDGSLFVYELWFSGLFDDVQYSTPKYGNSVRLVKNI